MASITIAPRLEDPTSDIESVVTGGTVQIRISAPVSTGGQWLLPIWSPAIPIEGAPVVVLLDPNATVAYEARFRLPSGEGVGEYLQFTEFRKVVDATPRAWDTLEQVGGPSAPAVVTSAIQSQLDAINARIDGISASGSASLGTISDMSPYMRTVNVATSGTAARTTLGVPAIGDAPAAHTHTVPSGLVATGTASSSTFLRGDGAWATPPVAGTPAWTDITGKPTLFPPDTTGLATDTELAAEVANTFIDLFCPGDVMVSRPSSSRRVRWYKATSPTIGGIGMLPRDSWVVWDGA